MKCSCVAVCVAVAVWCTDAILPSVFCIWAFSLLSRVGILEKRCGGGVRRQCYGRDGRRADGLQSWVGWDDSNGGAAEWVNWKRSGKTGCAQRSLLVLELLVNGVDSSRQRQHARPSHSWHKRRRNTRCCSSAATRYQQSRGKRQTSGLWCVRLEKLQVS